MTKDNTIYIGLMSGTSLDGVDVVAIQFGPSPQILASTMQKFPEALHGQLLALCAPADNEIERLGIADVQLGLFYAECVNTLIDSAGLNKHDIAAIGCHGQTIRHHPGANGFSLQIGSADALATKTNIVVVNNFRNKDMVLGGQGAPLVPAFHAALFGTTQTHCAVINIGGMANISVLKNGRLIAGYDTGPGNVLSDSWCMKHRGESFDKNGQWASTGDVIPSLLDDLLDEPYFHRPAPKSTGRELFNPNWLLKYLAGDEKTEDIQATLVELTAVSIVQELNKYQPEACYLCGGGTHNRLLMQRLQALLGDTPCSTTETLGIHPDWVEACAFAWLARARLTASPGNAPCVTGATRHAILGAVTLP